MLHWTKFFELSSEEFARADVATKNLACAQGLPGAERFDFAACLERLDYWALCVRRYTERLLPQFHRKRCDFGNSEAYFRALAMITVLQRDMGLRYNPNKIADDAVFEAADSFICGAVIGQGGTCATIPVVYTSVGRRLGYPIKLVAARGQVWGHCFARWDDPSGERFNIEAANKGLTCPPDDYYRTGEYEISPENEEAGGYLRSMTAEQEFATFLGERGCCLAEAGVHREAALTSGWALGLVPHLKMFRDTFHFRMQSWHHRMNRDKPPDFPGVWVRTSGRRFPHSVPMEMELSYLGLETT